MGQIPVVFVYRPEWWGQSTPERRSQAYRLAMKEYPDACFFFVDGGLIGMMLAAPKEAPYRAVTLSEHLFAAIEYGLCQ